MFKQSHLKFVLFEALLLKGYNNCYVIGECYFMIIFLLPQRSISVFYTNNATKILKKTKYKKKVENILQNPIYFNKYAHYTEVKDYRLVYFGLDFHKSAISNAYATIVFVSK